MKEVPSVPVASFKVCIEKSGLDNMHTMGKFDGIAPDKSVEEFSPDDKAKFIRREISYEKGVEVEPCNYQKSC